MDRALSGIVSKAAAWAEAGPPENPGAQLMADLRPLGATVFNSRVYWRPRGDVTPHKLWRLNGFQERIAPHGWTQTREHDYICLDHNPLIEAPRRRLTRFRFSDLAPKDAPEHGPYWDAWGRSGTGDGLGLLVHSPDGRTASLAFGFERMDDLSPASIDLIALVGRGLLTRLLDSGVGLPAPPALSVRERQVMALVARGLTDEAIAGALSMRPTTARAHVDNARRKLDAANRTEAAVLFVRWGFDAQG